MYEMSGQYIPLLSEKLSISVFDSRSYLLCIDKDKPIKLKISPGTKLLIEQIDGKKNMEEITRSFNEISCSQLPVEALIKIIQDYLTGYGVLQNDREKKLRARDRYIKLKVKLLPEKTVHHFVSFLLFLFNKSIFRSVSLLCVAFLSIIFISFCDVKALYADLSVISTAWFIALNIFGIVLHEMGHAAACEKFGARTGAIGFGFYLFTPVFYTDVSDAWRLKRYERLIVDLAGVYMQLILCTLLTFVFLISGNIFYLNTAFLIAATIIITLSPFLRYDGYWAVTDMLNVPNLRENSNKKLQNFCRWIFGKKNNWVSSWRNAFLASYALISGLIIVYFLLYIIIYNSHSVLYFPINFLNFIKILFTHFRDITFDWIKPQLMELFIPFLFYLFLYRQVKNKIFPLKS